MPWPGTLTQEQQDTVQENDKQLRAAVGAMARALEQLDAVLSHYDGAVSPLWAGSGLAGSDLIPQTSGLAGVESQTLTAYQAIVSNIATLLATDNTTARREIYAKLAGPVNIG